MKTVNVGVVGYGTVGKGAVETMINNKEMIKVKTGININILGVADRNIYKKITPVLDHVSIKTTNADELINDPRIDIIVELVGGDTFAKDIIVKAIKNKKHVVTANKFLLATQGKDIFKLAEENGVEVAFEASVGGGIPVIKVIKEDLAANDITEIVAIINGTANYILSRMQNEGSDYIDVLKDAQKLGYAETDPTFDVEGIDAAHKITLLASLAFCTWVEFKDVFVEGITKISATDIELAKELGGTIKLLAIAKKDGGKIDVRVHPTIIPNTYMLANVNDAFNALQITGSSSGTTLLYGRGAGGLPTGSAVSADIIDIARNICANAVGRVACLGYVSGLEKNYEVKNMKEVKSAFYLRFSALDNPGVLSTIAGVLASNNISIRSALQRSPQSKGDSVPLVFLTHVATEQQVAAAVSEIDAMSCVSGKTVIIRVEGIN